MRRILVSVFSTETAAFEGLSTLKDLHRDGDITLYASTVLAKNADGEVSVRQAADRGPVGTVVGLLGGVLAGSVGGPVGMAVSASVGSVGGLMYDLFGVGIGGDFVDEVGETLKPGMSALVADMDESWTMPVDARLEVLNATTRWHIPGDILDDRLNRQAAATRAELDQLKAELAQAGNEARASIRASIHAQARKLEELDARIDRQVADADADFTARLASLRAQREQAAEHQQAAIDARATELKTNYEARRVKLERASELSREARELRIDALTLAG